MQAGSTTTFVKPFTASNLVIAAVKEKLLENIEDDKDKKVVKKLIEDGDARLLLTWILKSNQK